MKNFQQYLEAAIKNKTRFQKYSCNNNQCNFSLEYLGKYYQFSILQKESDITPEQVIAKINELVENQLWVDLLNCHLAPLFMPTLDGVIENIEENRRAYRELLFTSP
jgi:hypothetical protein